jgi:hypothetical protein
MHPLTGAVSALAMFIGCTPLHRNNIPQLRVHAGGRVLLLLPGFPFLARLQCCCILHSVPSTAWYCSLTVARRRYLGQAPADAAVCRMLVAVSFDTISSKKVTGPTCNYSLSLSFDTAASNAASSATALIDLKCV